MERTKNGKTGLLGVERGGISPTIDCPMPGHGRDVCVPLEVESADISPGERTGEPPSGHSAPFQAEVLVSLRHVPGLIVVMLLLPAPADAQHPPSTLALSGGYAGFVDDDTVEHVSVGAAWRWRITRRFSVGPELDFMAGPRADRDLFVTLKVLVDFMPDRKLSPYVVADGGIMLHRDEIGSRPGPFWGREGAGSVGGGIRVDLSRRVFVAPETRIGWEPHIRVTAVVGWRM